MRLIVGLGNPGIEYENTRHNMGFLVVQAFAKQKGCSFKRTFNGMADVAQVEVQGCKVILLLPLTYMNVSGQAVELFVNYFKLTSEDVLVVCDDAALERSQLRLRYGGSSGGHNGLKSIEMHLRTQQYARLKVGIGSPLQMSLADHVLGHFTAEERLQMPEMIEKAIKMIDLWIVQSLKNKENS